MIESELGRGEQRPDQLAARLAAVLMFREELRELRLLVALRRTAQNRPHRHFNDLSRVGQVRF